jgi:hypothetical protein
MGSSRSLRRTGRAENRRERGRDLIWINALRRNAGRRSENRVDERRHRNITFRQLAARSLGIAENTAVPA